MKLLALTATLVAIAIGTGMLTLGALDHALLVYLLSRLILLPVALILVIWLIIGLKRTGGISTRLKNTFLISLIVGGAMQVSLYAGDIACDYHVRRAREFVEQVAPMLEGYKATYGMYPVMLDDPRLGVPPLPRLISPLASYTSTGKQFRFSFHAPSEWRDHVFDSESQSWDYKK